ncbi:MAG: hypothetical protein H6993_03095 [Pseudomonadales bacterium]|nr:hypothetical protein [Pseudomonadales bacterium]MCP5182918.1 hypothetical protein [Pseudomonadales bacterium]
MPGIGWGATLGVAAAGLIAGILGGLLIGIATVSWYQVSSFEGKSGYYAVGITLLGGCIGFLTALIIAWTVKGGAGALAATVLGAMAIATACLLLILWLMAPAADHPAGVAQAKPSRPADQAVPYTALPDESASIGEWLHLLRYNGDARLRVAVIAHLTRRPSLGTELADSIAGDDDDFAGALFALAQLDAASVPNRHTLLTQAADIVDRQIHAAATTPADEDPGYALAASASLRFSAWLAAAGDATGRETRWTQRLRRWNALAESRPDSIALADILRQTRHRLATEGETTGSTP